MKKKELMTWTLRIQNDDYRHDWERYGNKITSLGFHEWDVDAQGRIAIYKLGTEKDAQGSFIDGEWTDATTYDRYASGRTLWPAYIEPDMKRWPHVEYYLQMVMFGPETVSRVLDSTTAQDNFISNLKKVVALFRKDKNGNDLGYTGLEMDIEGSFSDDKWDVRAGDNVKTINLLKRIKNEVIIDANPDFKLRINAHAMWGAGVPAYYRFHDYKLFADSVDKLGQPLLDEVQIMTYDFSWSGSAPGPSTPLWWMDQVASWARECFDPAVNPNAKCTIDKVYLGGAGYGRRWPIYNEDTWGSSVTYRNLVDWQNGYYITYRNDETMADQDFIPMNAFNDPNSDNQIMYPHMYDYFKARHLKKTRSMDQVTARLSTYNGIEYATAYSKNQHMKITGLKGITGITGSSEPTDNLTYTNSQGAVLRYDTTRRDETIALEIGSQSYTFQGYHTRRVPFVPTTQEDGSIVCQLSKQPETVLTYKVNVPSAGTYDIGAVVSFPFYQYTKLNGSVNGSPFTIGGDTLPDYYPMMFKKAHIWKIGRLSLNAGENTILINGAESHHGTVIFGFIVADAIDLEVIGGVMDANPTIEKYKKRDGTDAKLPNQIALTNEILRQSPRPAIMWEDFFRQFLTDKLVQGDSARELNLPLSYTNSGLQATTYYKYDGDKEDRGGGAILSDDKTYCYENRSNGYTQGYWQVIEDENGVACAHFDPDHALNPNGRRSAQLCLNYEFKVMNISAEVQFSMADGDRAGIRFASTGPGDGYLFLVDFKAQTVSFGDEISGTFYPKASASLGDFAVAYGDRITMRVRTNNGKARCTIGGLNLLGDQTVSMQPGGIGFIAINGHANLYMMSLGTTERWETLERMSLIVNGFEHKIGEISRPGISRDSYGYLILSAFDEYSTREVRADGTREEIALDYIFKPVYVDTWEGVKNIQIKLIDAGLWYKQLYIGDAEGMSITYAGDEESFNRAMNIAVYDYGFKGIGLWVLGQADPRIFETLPDVVAWHE